NCISLLQSSKEEDDIEAMIIELVKSDKFKNFNIDLTPTQLKVLENTIKYDLPLKFFILSLERSQKVGMLEMLFVVIFSDHNNENAYECFEMFTLYMWYFHFEDNYFKIEKYQNFYMHLFEELNDNC